MAKETKRVNPILDFLWNWCLFYGIVVVVIFTVVAFVFFIIGIGDIIFVGDIWKGLGEIIGSAVWVGLIAAVVYTIARDIK